MTTQEHLQRIKAKCESLLELAAKRTPGKWYVDYAQGVIAPNHGPITYILADSSEKPAPDASFIASCAGPAEAGWRATIAAIDSCMADEPAYQRMFNIANEQLILGILAAWPEELL